MSFKFVGFESDSGRTIMLNLSQVVALEDTSHGSGGKPRLQVYFQGDAKGEPRYTLSLSIKEFFEKCKLI